MHAVKTQAVQPTVAADSAPAAGPMREAPRPLRMPGVPARPAARLASWRMRAVRNRALSLALWIVSLAALYAVWHFGTLQRWDFYIRFTNIPAPGEVFHKLLEVNQSSKFAVNVGISLRRILSGFGIAIAIAVPLGLLVGSYRVVRDLVMPVCEVLRPIPAIAWVPMSIMLWPTNEVSIVFITFLGSFFPILLNTIHGVTAFDQVLVRAGRCLGAGGVTLFWNVILPGALPQIFTGLAVGMGVAWVSLIAAEMISGQFGIGYFTWEAYSLVNYAEIALGMITIGVLGLACSGAIKVTGMLLMPWAGHGGAKK